MTKLKNVIATSFLGIAMVSAPLVGFAKDNNHGVDNHNRAKVKVEQRAALRAQLKASKNSDSNHGDNSIFGRILNLFETRADAAVSSKASLTPSISGITAPTVLKAGAEGTWTVNASDPQNGSLSYAVDWGEKSIMARVFGKDEPVFVQTSTFTHTYADPGVYTVKFTVKNSAGLSASSSVSVKITGEATKNAPVISHLSARSNSSDQAVLRWITNVPSTSSVWFGKESPVDVSGDAQVVRSGRVFFHTVVLKGLEAGTKYYAVVGSSNKAGDETKSAEISFTTKADILTPVITSLSGSSTAVAGEETTVTVNAYDPKNDSLTYSADWGDNISGMALMRAQEEPFVQSATFSHIYATPGTYTATFTAQNSSGLKASSSLKITVAEAPADTVKPVVSDIHVTADSNSAVTITWKTDELANSEVFYSTTSPVDVTSDSAISVASDSMVVEHSIQLTGLNAGTTYYYVIQSSDDSDNLGSAAEATFTTSA